MKGYNLLGLLELKLELGTRVKCKDKNDVKIFFFNDGDFGEDLYFEDNEHWSTMMTLTELAMCVFILDGRDERENLKIGDKVLYDDGEGLEEVTFLANDPLGLAFIQLKCGTVVECELNEIKIKKEVNTNGKI